MKRIKTTELIFGIMFRFLDFLGYKYIIESRKERIELYVFGKMETIINKLIKQK